MLAKRLQDITVADIQALLGVTETQYLDFKSAPIGAADQSLSLMCPRSQMRRAAISYLEFGRKTVASAVTGISIPDPVTITCLPAVKGVHDQA